MVSLLVALLPFIIFQAGTIAYEELNGHYFGVKETNTRTEGELGEFVENVYRIESKSRTKYVWAPYDAIEKAFEASETLSQHPELKSSILSNEWFNKDGIQEQINGDFLGWVLRTSLAESGLWENEAQVQSLFEKANNEIEEAFSNGELGREQKYSLVSSAGPRSSEEIADLADDAMVAFTSPIFFPGYRMEPKEFHDDGVVQPSEPELYLLNQPVGKESNPGIRKLENIKISTGTLFSKADLAIYHAIAPVMFFAGILGLILCIAHRVKSRTPLTRNQWLSLIAALMLLALAIIYAFGISWFSEFIYKDSLEDRAIILTFYGIAIIPMLYFASLLGVALLVNLFTGRPIRALIQTCSKAPTFIARKIDEEIQKSGKS